MNFLLIYEGYENTGEHSSLSSNYIIIFIFQMLYYILYFLLFIIISHVGVSIQTINQPKVKKEEEE